MILVGHAHWTIVLLPHFGKRRDQTLTWSVMYDFLPLFVRGYRHMCVFCRIERDDSLTVLQTVYAASHTSAMALVAVN